MFCNKMLSKYGWKSCRLNQLMETDNKMLIKLNRFNVRSNIF